MTVANTIPGGGFTSRILQHIREEKGYSYSPRSSVRANRVGGSTLASVDVRNDVTGATLGEWSNLYHSMASEPASGERLSGAKRLVGDIYLLRNQIRAR